MRRPGLLALTCLLLACVGWAPAASAQDGPWQFMVKPYLWAAGIKGTVTTPASKVDFDVGFIETLKDLDGVPVMMAAEIRKGNIALLLDLIWLRTKSDIHTRGVLFDDGSAKLGTLQTSAAGLYRFFDNQTVSVEAGAGFRLWSVKTRAHLNAGILPAQTASMHTSFIDPILAARFDVRFGQGWSATVLGDVGGFGISSRLTWQVLGTVNYKVQDWASIGLGWRHMAVDRDKVQLDMSGPIMVTSVRF